MEGQETEQFSSRQQRVLEAKAAFHPNSSYSRQAGSVSRDIQQNRFASEVTEGDLQKKHTFRLLRIMTAGMLFFVLVIAFSNGFSYHGFDQAYVQAKLDDETTWNRLEKQVQKIYLSLEKQWKEIDEK